MKKNAQRQMPNDINAEAAVLSAMMLDNYVVAKAVELLEVSNFYRPAHQKIFKAIINLFEKNIEVDIIARYLERMLQCGKIGGGLTNNDDSLLEKIHDMYDGETTA